MLSVTQKSGLKLSFLELDSYLMGAGGLNLQQNKKHSKEWFYIHRPRFRKPKFYPKCYCSKSSVISRDIKGSLNCSDGLWHD